MKYNVNKVCIQPKLRHKIKCLIGRFSLIGRMRVPIVFYFLDEVVGREYVVAAMRKSEHVNVLRTGVCPVLLLKTGVLMV